MYFTEFFSCRFVLNVMVILGFMLNYALRVNLTIGKKDDLMSEVTTYEINLHLQQLWPWSDTIPQTPQQMVTI